MNKNKTYRAYENEINAFYVNCNVAFKNYITDIYYVIIMNIVDKAIV